MWSIRKRDVISLHWLDQANHKKCIMRFRLRFPLTMSTVLEKKAMQTSRKFTAFQITNDLIIDYLSVFLSDSNEKVALSPKHTSSFFFF